MLRLAALAALTVTAAACGDNLELADARPTSDAQPIGDADPTELNVIETSPSANAISAPAMAGLVVAFDRALDPTSIDARSVRGFGQWTGALGGVLEVDAADPTRLVWQPERLLPGDLVTVQLSRDLRGADGAPMRDAGYAFQFRVAAAPATMSFSEYARMSTRSNPDEYGQVYGGVAADVNEDGAPDITVVNEASDDVVVFVNRGDGSGLLDRTESVYGVGTRPSPSETADFDGDGHTDLVVVNIGSYDLTFLHGAGDGSFGRQARAGVGANPRGVTVFDADGDGDTDVVTTSVLGSELQLVRNDGAGGFAAAEAIDNDDNGEWAVTSADMNGDGVLDLVIGSNVDGRITVRLGRGDGTFAHRSTQVASEDLWQINAADLDGDGDVDVVVAGGEAANVTGADGAGVVLLNDGTGVLGAPEYYPTDPRTLATDLGDLDGDGDLDWVLSSVGGENSDWTFLANDGDGSFTVLREWDSPADASCALLADLDGDGDLDIGLLDEAEDLLILLENQ